MPIIDLHAKNPLEDGRQSARALRIRRGVQQLLTGLGATHLPELTLANGRRADIVALFRDGSIWIVEIKSSVEDMKADSKWPEYRDYCDRLFFATLEDVPEEIFPADCGFIRADTHGGALLREAPEHKLAGARRKAVTLRIAQSAAQRLYRAELSGVELPE
ncbi:MmcB family DNA repair protein [Oricola thermophila]|uniref:MmcB family DNA repair protein n=1 Tax=Oricola thermophila TaxID=2742145 RepID=A0A6N1VJH7_9HYPH|nr:MmcB family DNA repair protein [Oricola thermophila]QKV19572.1 MmcB family DNA repair protein [Oricola thermophila]